MNKKIMKSTLLAAVFFFSTLPATAEIKINQGSPLQYLGEYSLPSSHVFDGVKFGGISGLVYDTKQQQYYAISDARNTPQEGVSRVYQLTIDTSSKGINAVNIERMVPLLDEQGKNWVKGSVDAEGIALTPYNGNLYWSSELGSPLRISDRQGKLIADLHAAVPAHYNIGGKKEDKFGVRDGLSFEGLSVSPDGKFLFLAVESALKQDGNISTPISSSSSRIMKFAIGKSDQDLTLVGEYLYHIDPIPRVSTFGINDNGVSEILALSNQRLLVIERAGRNASEGYNDWDFNIRTYLVDLNQAHDVSAYPSISDIKEKNKLQYAEKRLIIDFADYTDAPDCIESVTFGPLIDGNKTLLFASDNNFQPYQSNKFFLFKDSHDLLK